MVYIVECNKPYCKQQYIEESERSLKDQISEHIGYVKAQKLDKSIGQHFNNQEIHYQT